MRGKATILLMLASPLLQLLDSRASNVLAPVHLQFVGPFPDRFLCVRASAGAEPTVAKEAFARGGMPQQFIG